MSTRRVQVVALLAMFCLAALPVRGDDKKNDVDGIGNRKVAHKSIISEEKEIAIGKQYCAEKSSVPRSCSKIRSSTSMSTEWRRTWRGTPTSRSRSR